MPWPTMDPAAAAAARDVVWRRWERGPGNRPGPRSLAAAARPACFAGHQRPRTTPYLLRSGRWRERRPETSATGYRPPSANLRPVCPTNSALEGPSVTVDTAVPPFVAWSPCTLAGQALRGGGVLAGLVSWGQRGSNVMATPNPASLMEFLPAGRPWASDGRCRSYFRFGPIPGNGLVGRGRGGCWCWSGLSDARRLGHEVSGGGAGAAR